MGSCQLGRHFPRWLRAQKSISFIDISDTGISGTVPGWFWNFSSQLKLMNLSMNGLKGNVPDLISKKLLYFIDLSDNYFSGPLPRFPPNMWIVRLSRNSFSGPILPLCKMLIPALVYLDLSYNSLSGPIPNCSEFAPNLVILKLGRNNLTGKIPDSIGTLSQLRTLQLEGNRISGGIPASFCDCRSLMVLDLAGNMLSGRIPPCIDKNFSNLMVLILGGNKLEGHIPSQLCDIITLQILDLARNNLSGQIPRCLGDLEGMTAYGGARYTISYPYPAHVEHSQLTTEGRQFFKDNNLLFMKGIDLSSNNFYGEIPREVTSLIGLVALNLSRNQLTGLIPPGVGEISALESLDLSMNQLSCAIPVNMSSLFFLEILNLSYNTLSGPIPQAHQFLTFDNSTYMGNFNLCGSPLELECSEHQVLESSKCTTEWSQDNNKSNEVKTEHGMKVPPFDLGAGLGFLAAFWGFWAALVFHRPWRHAYFRFIDAMMDKIYVAAVVAIRRVQRKVSDQAIL